MKPIINQPFGDIFCINASGMFERANINDHFMRHITALTAIQNRISPLQPGGNVIRVKQNTANRPDLRAPIYLFNDFRYHLIYDRHPNTYPWP